MTDIDTIEASLMLSAERRGDISDALYQRFFADNPEAAKVMGHADSYMRGRMAAQTVDVVLGSDGSDDNYLRWEVGNHLQAYQVEPAMYQSYFLALKAVVQEDLGNDWTQVQESAWRRRLEHLLAQVASA